MGLDDLYNNFKIVEQKVKRTVAVNNDDKNLAFLTTTSPSSTNSINTANTGVSTGNSKVNTASAETSTASFSDATALLPFVLKTKKARENTDAPIIEIGFNDEEELSIPRKKRKRPLRPRGIKELNYNCPNAYKHMVPRAILMRTGLKTVKNAKPLSTARHILKHCSLSDFKELDGGIDTFGEEQMRKNHWTPQQNGVAERKNRTLIEAARTMLADSKLPTTFWAEAVSTACYVQNRVLVVKPHNKTPYELFRGIKPAIGFMKPFGCHVTILNTLDKLGKFDGKSDEGFFVGYSLSSKAFRVYNIRTRKVQENLHVGFLENKPMLEGNGPKWLFDLDSLTQTMNYVPVVAGTFSNVSAGMQEGSESNISSQKDQDCIFMPIWKDASYFEDITPQSVDDVQLQDQDGNHDDCSFQDDGIDDHQVNTASPQVNTASPQVNTGSRELSTADSEVNTATSEGLMGPIPTTEDSQEEDQGIDLGNLSPSYAVSSTPHTSEFTRIIQLTCDCAIYEGKTHQDLHTCLFACFLSQEEPKRVSKALSDPAWVEAMQEELLQFKLQNVWVLVDLPKGIRAMYKVVYRNKKDERGHWFEDPDHPDKVYKVVKALYGLHQAGLGERRYDTLATYLLSNGFKSQIDQTLFIKSHQGHILLVQIYVDDIIFGSTKKEPV
ncbi:putative ribonuclease H-like domain-containing protein [Tanacetum coccineum]